MNSPGPAEAQPIEDMRALHDPLSRSCADAEQTGDGIERRRTELALEQARREIHNILETISATFISLDREWRFRYLNRHALQVAGAPLKDLLGHTIWEKYPQLLGTPVETQYRKAMAEQVAVHFEIRCPLSGRWLEVHAYPSPEGLAIYGQDISERKRAEAGLRETSQALQTLIHASPLGIIALDRMGVVTAWNPAAEHIFGWLAEEVLGRLLPIIPPDKQEEFRAFRAAELRSEARAGTELRRLRKDGSLVDVSIWTAPVTDAGGEVQSTIGIVADITERKRAEEKLQDSHNLLHAVVEGISQAIYVKDRQGRYLMVNSAVARLVGKPFEEILGRDDTALFEAETARQFMQADRRIMERGEAETYEDFATVAGLTRAFLTTKAPYRGLNREVIGVVGTSRDISKRKQAEETLRTTQEFLSRLLENIPAVVYVHSSDGRTRLLNRAWEEQWRLPRDRSLGCRLEELFPPELAKRFLASDQQVVATAAPMVFDELADIQGRPRWFHTVKFPLCDAAGRIDAVGGISIDITDRQLAEEAMRDYAERLQSLSRRLVNVQEEERHHLARELHDEIGQILTAVFYNLQAIKGSCGAAVLHRLEETVGIVDRAIQQVRSLTFDLRPPMLDDLGLAAAVKWYVDEQCQRTGLAAHVVAPPSGAFLPPEVKNCCFRVAQEALTNVVRHARAQQVWLDLHQHEDEVRLVIRDDGVGFDIVAARQRAAQGECFGLLGMQERVEMLGGRIALESQPGHGTTVRVWLPQPVLSPQQQGDTREGKATKGGG
jgi:PAS domain S-box-containing protein